MAFPLATPSTLTFRLNAVRLLVHVAEEIVRDALAMLNKEDPVTPLRLWVEVHRLIQELEDLRHEAERACEEFPMVAEMPIPLESRTSTE